VQALVDVYNDLFTFFLECLPLLKGASPGNKVAVSIAGTLTIIVSSVGSHVRIFEYQLDSQTLEIVQKVNDQHHAMLPNSDYVRRCLGCCKQNCTYVVRLWKNGEGLKDLFKSMLSIW
jgi:hypothetical protein